MNVGLRFERQGNTEVMLKVFDNDSIRRILHMRRKDCAPTVELRRSSSKEGFIGLTMLQGELI